jgi:hypothetical protein
LGGHIVKPAIRGIRIRVKAHDVALDAILGEMIRALAVNRLLEGVRMERSDQGPCTSSSRPPLWHQAQATSPLYVAAVIFWVRFVVPLVAVTIVTRTA